MESFVVDAGVMCEFVDDRDAHLRGEIVRVREVGLERQLEEGDLVGEGDHVRAPLCGWHALVQPVEPAVGRGPGQARLLARRQLLDDDGDVVEQPTELLGQVVESALHECLERHMDLGWQVHGMVGMSASQLLAAFEWHGLRMARRGRTYAQDVSRANPAPESMVVQLQSGERIHYLDWAGGTGMPIVLIHGLSRTAWTWLPIAPRLALGHPVIAPDLRGHGASDAPLNGYELESLALDVLTVVAGCGWGEAVDGPTVVLAGHGLGAIIAAEMARLQPASVAGVALLDAGWEEMVDATRMLPDQLIEAIADPPEVLASMESYLEDRRAFDPVSWDADQEVAARAQVVEKHAGHVRPVTKGSVVRRAVASMYTYKPLETLSQVVCPLTVLVANIGTADDEDERERRLALEDVGRVREQAGLPAVHVRRFDGAGHDLMRYRPDEVADEIERLTT